MAESQCGRPGCNYWSLLTTNFDGGPEPRARGLAAKPAALSLEPARPCFGAGTPSCRRGRMGQHPRPEGRPAPDETEGLLRILRSTTPAFRELCPTMTSLAFAQHLKCW